MAEHARRISRRDTRRSEIRESLRVFHPPGSLFEVRAIGCSDRGRPYVAAGWFNDAARAARAVIECERRQRPQGVYATLNPCDPALLARSPNRLVPYPTATTADQDILGRRWLLIDLDPVRPSGVSSTDSELAAALLLSKQVRHFLQREMGWPKPAVALSGNGMHLLYPIDLPNDESSKRLVADVLAGLSHRFRDWSHDRHRVHVDSTTASAAQLVKAYGTLSRKGCHTPERPHRRSRLLSVPKLVRKKVLS